MITFLFYFFGVMSAAMFIVYKEKKYEWAASWAVVFALLYGVFGSAYVQQHRPKPIDVYRGKTTLEITYRDSVAIDSTVVYKMR